MYIRAREDFSDTKSLGAHHRTSTHSRLVTLVGILILYLVRDFSEGAEREPHEC